MGQARVLPLAISVFGAGLALMMLAVEQGWARPWTYVFAAVAGASLPQVGASVRTRWSHLLDEPGDKQTAFALEAPVSTTHTITSAIMGVGATKRLSAVRWGVAKNILMAWVLTIPMAALVAAGTYVVLRPFLA